jgi:hypothetical protein
MTQRSPLVRFSPRTVSEQRPALKSEWVTRAGRMRGLHHSALVSPQHLTHLGYVNNRDKPLENNFHSRVRARLSSKDTQLDKGTRRLK